MQTKTDSNCNLSVNMFATMHLQKLLSRLVGRYHSFYFVATVAFELYRCDLVLQEYESQTCCQP